MKGNITLNEEKVIIKEIADLSRSLQFVGPLEVITRKMEEARTEKKKIKEKLDVLYTQNKKINEEIDELKADLDKMHNVINLKKS